MFSEMILWVELRLKIGTNKQKMRVKMMGLMFKSNYVDNIFIIFLIFHTIIFAFIFKHLVV